MNDHVFTASRKNKDIFRIDERDYDLTNLAKSPYYFDTVNETSLYWNFRKSVDVTKISRCENTDEYQVAVHVTKDQCWLVASITPEDHTVIGKHKGIHFSYINSRGGGDFQIFFQCSKKESRAAVQTDSDSFEVTWNHPQACPMPIPLSWGTWTLIGIGGCVILYIIIGALYSFCVLGKKGRAIFPNYYFWAEIPSLVKDGVNLIFSPCTRGKEHYGKMEDGKK
eukprot:MONOS_8583.1-p1 / transcript=MONOS_8583.1 / gene=MONOS_8583 / organism=Monocercomonoides_exilis_PA203 / gene_product=unspecified product / transcript_product=unspecified product / location=Mono_scaffold00327:15527-16915(-) / protein_length=223 / sequence_SO=supercontig / SO=protein_coding / is_pseudo=false